MRRYAAATAALMLALASATPASAQRIQGSAHDFSGSGWSGGQICIVCHTPHNADQTLSGAPLWNHELTQQVYVVYSSPTLDAMDLAQPSGVSRLCLSCHDGTVALDSYGGATGSTYMAGREAVGRDGLADDHPISFTYDAALVMADGELHDPQTQLSGLGGTVREDMLFQNRVECASCHDVHGTAYRHLLRMHNSGSLLCLTCHRK